MPSGGPRPGSGRPRKAEKFQRPIARAEKRIADRLPWLIDQQFELAEGVLAEEGKDGEEKVYKRPPDRQAVEYLLNRIMGKPTERQELTGKDGEPLDRTDALRAILEDPEAYALASRLADRLAVAAGHAGAHPDAGDVRPAPAPEAAG